MKKYSPFAILLLILGYLLLPAPAGASSLKQGMQSGDVKLMQTRLAELGYLTGNPDGVFGEETHEALTSFQADYGLEPDGVAGDATLRVLFDPRITEQTVSRAGSEFRKGQQIVRFAKQFIGVPYVWAGHSPGGFDCSGFTSYIYGQYHIDIPRMADEQFEVGREVNKMDIIPGDMVFFSTYEPGPSHVGIYIGGGQFIHASSGADKVTITPLNKDYYTERYLGARRVIK